MNERDDNLVHQLTRIVRRALRPSLATGALEGLIRALARRHARAVSAGCPTCRARLVQVVAQELYQCCAGRLEALPRDHCPGTIGPAQDTHAQRQPS